MLVVRKPLAMLAVASLAILMFATPATAATLVDQQQGGSSQGTCPSLPMGQTFTPTVNNITGFDLTTWFSGPGTVEIWRWADKAVLTSLTATLGSDAHVDLPEPVSLVPGTKYAIMLTAGDFTCMATLIRDPYPGGAFVYDGGENGYYDAYFRTYYESTLVPPVTATDPTVVPETCEGQASGINAPGITGVRYTGIGDVNGIHTQKFVGPGFTPFDPGQKVYVYAEPLSGHVLVNADPDGKVRWYLDLPAAPSCGWFALEASLAWPWIHGQDWEGDLVSGDLADVIVMDVDGTTELLNTTVTVEARDPGPGGSFEVTPPFDLQPGMTVTATASGITKTLTLMPLSIDAIDRQTGVVTGTASPDIPADSILHVDTDISADGSGNYIGDTPGTDGSGNWTVDFGQPLVPGNDTGADISDEDGDSTIFDMMVPEAPSFTLEVNDDAIYGGDAYRPWAGPVTITVERGIETFELGQVPLYDPQQEGFFWHEFSGPSEGLEAFDFQTWDVVTVTDGTNTKVLVLTPIEVTALTVDTDVISGMCSPEVSATVEVYSNYGGAAETGCTPGGTFDATGLIDVLIDDYGGAKQYDSDGDAVSFSWYPPPEFAFEGFFAPVNNGGVDNVAKAGKTIPLKWRVLDANGNPVSDPSFFVAVETSPGADACAGGLEDAIEVYSGGSGLQYLGDGYWQLNWKTPATYANKCRIVGLEFANGQYFGDVQFQFK